ncbi:MAG: oxygen-independent coproporphyrinogen III oxidase [gamma proteobacterium symbiont of Bathyaustriella thionipta]|nr:oxygen-independent coproporphyrinogen III oxidase [gamma proteobacterium symbiont of Bathyaustriella thionipta]
MKTDQSLQFEPELLKKYDRSGPRYTSYPTAVQFTDRFTEADLQAAIARSNEQANPLSFYFHIPFCDTLCFYCGCNKIATKDRSKTAPYLQRLLQELQMYRVLLNPQREVQQLHLGGGTPTFMSMPEMAQLMSAVFDHFKCANDDQGEYSIEIDPREITPQGVAELRRMGFNRISLGVQDFEADVQKAVNRIQSEEQTFAVIQAARDNDFRSISIDLIYGLPHQTVESFSRTLQKIIHVAPDRLSIFNYAHLPELFKPQRRINESDLPSAEEKLRILQSCIRELNAAGYIHIGMDHFAKPDDELSIAQREGKLHRNFQGYSTNAGCDMLGLGVSSIGKIADTYVQNFKGLDDYYQAIDSDHFALQRGLRLNAEDRLRRAFINQLICHYSLDMQAFGDEWNIDVKQHFAAELSNLQDMQADGLLQLDERQIVILPKGRLLVRNICMVFDQYLKQQQGSSRFSKAI